MGDNRVKFLIYNAPGKGYTSTMINFRRLLMGFAVLVLGTGFLAPSVSCGALQETKSCCCPTSDSKSNCCSTQESNDCPVIKNSEAFPWALLPSRFEFSSHFIFGEIVEPLLVNQETTSVFEFAHHSFSAPPLDDSSTSPRAPPAHA
ncbi:MAG: hypothetical protein KCHDKBKB_02341 [Elusimicrobia bacterium]|nr:hypothetical protein [Elusimicrobiota bacterium]